jgi:hypothetical protein
VALSLNKPKLDNLSGNIWKSAERLRGKFKAYEYQGVILPIIVIRRLECVLLVWREAKSAEVLAKRPKLTEEALAELVKELELNPQQSPFSNKTDWTLCKLYAEDHTLLEANFRAYINGFSKNVDDIMHEVCGFRLSRVAGTLKGFSRWSVKGEHYPAIVPDGKSRVEGVVFRNVPDSAWCRLDRSEGEMYARQVVRIELIDKSDLLAATYVVQPEFLDRLDPSDWNFADFLRC